MKASVYKEEQVAKNNKSEVILITSDQIEALKHLTKLPQLVESIQDDSIKEQFSVFSDLSVLSSIKGLEDLSALSELKKTE